MSRIKTRESVKDIKVIDKAAVASERMKTALVRSKDQFENLMDDGQVTPSEYAEDKIRYAAEDVADRVGHDVSAETKKAVNKGKEAYRKHREEKRIEKNEERVNRYEERFRREEQARTEKTSSKESHSHESTTRSSEPQGSAQSRSESASKRQAVSQKQNSIRQRKNVHQQNTARETASTGGEVRKNAVRGTRNQTIKTAERTEHTIKQSARSAGKKTVKTGAKGTVKSSEKTIKTAEKTSKAAIKTAEKTAKATQKAAQATAKAAQKAAEMARQAAIAAYKAAVAAAKAIAAAIKAIAAAIKELIAAIAAGGWVAVVVIIVICLIGLIVASCFGIFFSSEDTGSTQTMQQVVQEINLDYQNKLDDIKNSNTYDELEMSGSRAVWPEVLSIYAVKTTNDPDNPQEVASMTDEKKQLLKDIFWEMNEISYETEEKTETVIVETDDGEGNIVEEEVEETTVYLYITVSHKTVEEMMSQYGFTEDQKVQVAELLAQDSSMWASVLYGIYGADDQIVAVALSQLGNVGGEPYWSWYGFGSRVEWCACFVSWCADQCGYIETGVIPKYAGCVNGVNWFKDRGQWADNDIEPAPGMIIFFDWDNKGSSGPQDGESDHTGIVERVEDGIVYTVEGNSGDSCRENHYAVGYYEILGYGIPAY
ncbi:MAG: CHAP domain-containing protein [Eubacteriales bacterium]|jgi:hypothetical protein